MKKPCFFLLILAHLNTFSQGLQTDRYDAVYLSLVKEYTLNPDGSMDYHYAKVQRLQNYQSFHRLFGETFIVYNPEHQQLKINDSYTIMDNGKRIDTPRNGFNEVLPRLAAFAPDFNCLREMVITHTGLEIGATIHLDYEIHTDPDFFPFFSGNEILAGTEPVQELTVIIKIPENFKLYYRLFNSKLKPVITVKNGFRIYSWTQPEIQAIPPDDHKPAHNTNDPFLVFSTKNNWKDLALWYARQIANPDSLPGSLEDLISQRMAENKNNEKRTFAFQETIVNELRHYDIPDEYNGYRLRKPARVWTGNGGTTAEKAILLTVILKNSGINAKPVLVFNGSHLDERIVSLSELDDWLVKVEDKSGDPLFLSVKQVNAYNMTELLPGQQLLELNQDSTVEFFKIGEGKGTIRLTGNFEIKPDFVFSGKIAGSLAGSCNPRLALLRDSSKLKYYLGGGLASAEVKEIRLDLSQSKETDFDCDVSKINAMKSDSCFLFFQLPFLKSGIDNQAVTYLVAERSVPFELPAKLDETYCYSIHIPEDLIPLTYGIDINITNNAGSFLFKVDFNTGIIEVTKELHLKEALFSPGSYADFKDLMDNWNLRQNRELIFRID